MKNNSSALAPVSPSGRPVGLGLDVGAPSAPLTPVISAGGHDDYFSRVVVVPPPPTSTDPSSFGTPVALALPITPSGISEGGMMGRLKRFGKGSAKRSPSIEAAILLKEATAAAAKAEQEREQVRNSLHRDRYGLILTVFALLSFSTGSCVAASNGTVSASHFSQSRSILTLPLDYAGQLVK